MKMLFACLIFSSDFAQANQSCMREMAQQLDLGRTHITKLSLTAETAHFKIYSLNTTLDGGDALLEVVVRKADCKVLDKQYVWSE